MTALVGDRKSQFQWWFVATAIAITPVDISQIGLAAANGPDLIKWVVRFPFWYLPLAVLVPRWSRLPESLRRAPGSWFLAWAAFGATSVLWATAPDQALLVGVAILGLTMIATWYVYTAGWQLFASAVVAGITVFLGLGLVVDILEGTLVADRAWGLSAGPTTLGRIAALNAVLIAGLLARRPRVHLYWVALAISAAAIVFSETRTAMLAVLVSVLYGMRLSPSSRLVLIATVIIGGLAVAGLSSQVGEVSSFGERGDPTSIAGRTSVWPAAVEMIAERPFLGYGSGTAEKTFIQAARDGKLTFLAGTSHSIFLSPLLSGGLIGATLLFIALASGLRRRKSVDRWTFAVLLAVLISGLTEAIVHVPSLSIVLLAGFMASASLTGGRPITTSEPPAAAQPVWVEA